MQIETVAPVDVFASAGEKQMNKLAAKNLIDADSRKDFASNRLVLIVPQNSNLNLTNSDELSNLKVQKIASAIRNNYDYTICIFTDSFLVY